MGPIPPQAISLFAAPRSSFTHRCTGHAGPIAKPLSALRRSGGGVAARWWGVLRGDVGRVLQDRRRPSAHRGCAGDPLHRVRNILLHRAAGELAERQCARLVDCPERGDPNDEVLVAGQCYQHVRSAYAADTPADGKAIAEHIVATFASCPITEIARLGRTLRQWKDTYLGYFTTGEANNGGTEAVNGIIELHRRIARGYRNPDNYRLRMLLVTGGLLAPPICDEPANASRARPGRGLGR